MPIVITECPICKRSFDKGDKTQRVYCNPRCRAKAAKLKEKKKYGLALDESKANHAGIMWNPSLAVLEAQAKVAQSGGMVVPVFYAGVMPDGWVVPEGVEWMRLEPEGELPERWGMM